jgi:peptidoglycan/LPS O-acetylase OafA/YrhL
MLSRREGEALREIERLLAADDPALEVLLRTQRTDRWWRRARRVHDVLIVVSVLSAVLCLVLRQVGAGLAGAVFAAVVFQLRNHRFAPRPRPGDPG